jgi:hypothetical protein
MFFRVVVSLFLAILTALNGALVWKAYAPTVPPAPVKIQPAEWEYKIVPASSYSNLTDLVNGEAKGNWGFLFLDRSESWFQSYGVRTVTAHYLLFFKRQKTERSDPETPKKGKPVIPEEGKKGSGKAS